MGKKQTFFPVRFLRSLFDKRVAPNWLPILLVLLFGLVQATLVFAASYLDNTLFLPNEGDGFLEHYGVWAILASDPLLLIATSFAYRQFFISIRTLPINYDEGGTYALQRIIKPFSNFINMTGNSKFLYLFLVIVGFLSWLNNLKQTIDPSITYGNDVFDSSQYLLGFVANKACLFISWVIVYPLVGFMLLSMSWAIRQILKKVVFENRVRPKLIHPDSCYGLAKLGTLNISILLPFVLAYLTMFSLLITHEKSYLSIQIPLVVVTIVLLILSYVTIAPITRLSKKIHSETMERLAKEAVELEGNRTPPTLKFSLERSCLPTVTPSPYKGITASMISAIRLLPVAMTVSKIIVP